MPTPDTFFVRPARRSDLRVLGRLGAALAHAHHSWDPGRFFVVDDMEKGYAWWLGKELKNRRAVVLVAERCGRVIGYAYGRLERRDWNALRDACAVGVDLMVEPGQRGRGVGRALAMALLQALGRLRAPRVILLAAVPNRKAQRLFRQLGFRPTVIEMMRELAAEEKPPRGGRQSRRQLTASRRGPLRPPRSRSPAPRSARVFADNGHVAHLMRACSRPTAPRSKSALRRACRKRTCTTGSPNMPEHRVGSRRWRSGRKPCHTCCQG
jgi:GNAT superfamily N-acetyltransferase